MDLESAVASQTLIEKALEDEDLDRATERLKREAEDAVEGEFNEYKFDEVLRDREAVISSIQQSIGPALEEAKEKWSDAKEREDEDEFQQDRSDRSISPEDYDRLKQLVILYRRLFSQAVIMWYVDNQTVDKVESAIELQERRKYESKLAEQMNNWIEKSEGIGEEIAQGITQYTAQVRLEDFIEKEFDERLEAKLQEVDLELEEDLEVVDEVEELKNQLQELENRLEEAASNNAGSDEEDSTPSYEHTCEKCGYDWEGRKENPKQCPKCKSMEWNEEQD